MPIASWAQTIFRMAVDASIVAALEIVNHSSLGRTLGRERMHFTVARAVDVYLARRGTRAGNDRR